MKQAMTAGHQAAGPRQVRRVSRTSRHGRSGRSRAMSRGRPIPAARRSLSAYSGPFLTPPRQANSCTLGGALRGTSNPGNGNNHHEKASRGGSIHLRNTWQGPGALIAARRPLLRQPGRDRRVIALRISPADATSADRRVAVSLMGRSTGNHGRDEAGGSAGHAPGDPRRHLIVTRSSASSITA